MTDGHVPTIADIEAAREQVTGRARVTPIYGSETLSRMIGRKTWLKAENLQRTGSFKVRGAVNKLSTMTEPERSAGVVAASAGNHGQAVAWAARELGAQATIFMPEDAPMAKVEATRNYGATTVLSGAGFDEALAEAQASVERTGATFLHAFEDPAVIAGQGTIGLELAEGLPDVETFLVPIGGGGLAAGIAIALRSLKPGCRLVGVQAGKTGRGTIADGIAVKHPGVLTMSILDDLLDDIVHVEDHEIAQAIVLLLERSKLVVEGAGAASVAALLAGKAGGSGEVCVLLSGGNIDATLLISVMRHALTAAGRYLVVRTYVPDRPGGLLQLLELVAAERGNIVDIEHHREGMNIHVAETEVQLTVVTRDEDHCAQLCSAMEAQGYRVERLS
jgi:threonine dehydratase